MLLLRATRVRRNTAKLEEVTKEYEKVLKNATDTLGKAWEDRIRMMNNIIGRIISFQVCSKRAAKYTVARVRGAAGRTLLL